MNPQLDPPTSVPDYSHAGSQNVLSTPGATLPSRATTLGAYVEVSPSDECEFNAVVVPAIV